MPLSIVAAVGPVGIEGIAVRLDGRDVSIATWLANRTDGRQTVAFHASTPVFGSLGAAEEHADKRFGELQVFVQGTPARLLATPKAYFHGRDITALLTRAGIDPLAPGGAPARKLARLPAIDGDKPADWRASVTYSWRTALASGARSEHEVRYRAMPRFGLEMVGSARLARQIRQSCGDPAQVHGVIARADPAAETVLVERYDIPLDYMMQREVAVDVVQPAVNWLGARPVATLACGLESGAGGTALSGTLDPVDPVLGVLVISTLGAPGAPEK